MTNIRKYSIALCLFLACGATEVEAQLSVGYYKFKNGAEYTGQLKRRRPNGMGRTVYPNGDLYEGVVETIRKLAEKYPLFIVSNCQCGYIEVMIESSGIGPFIRDHLCFGETGTPKSETIRALMDRNDLKDVVYVGDTQGDADACRDAGVPFVFAEYGFGDVPDAETRIGRISDLCEMYL